jgi:ribosomal protection tetracycline resistance protein
VRTLNLGILAHVDAGKTSLTERLLHNAGVIDEIGSVDDGSTQTDSLALERQRGITIKSAVVSFVIGDVTVNLIDTPGHPDFIAEVERVLHVLDGAVLVISAVEGVQPQTRVLMRVLSRLGLPTLIFVNKIDRAGARYDSLLRDIAGKLVAGIVPMGSTIGLGTRGARYVPSDGDDARFLARLVDTLSSHDDTLLASYVDNNAVVSYQRLRADLAAQTRQAVSHPVFFGSAITGAGVDELMAGIPELLPAVAGDIDGPPSGSVFKVERGPAGEKIAYVRMFSGTLHLRDRLPAAVMLDSGDEPTGADPKLATRVTAISVFERGHAHRRTSVSAGHIAKLWGLGDVRVGDPIGKPRVAASRQFSPPTLETVVVPVRPGDKGPLHAALTQLAEQDPLINLRRDDLRSETFISLYGEVQKEVIEATLADEFGIAVTFRETTTIHIERPAGTGAAYEIIDVPPNPFLATVGLRVEPAPQGAGIRFRLAVEPGSMPSSFMKAVEETVSSTLSQGIHGWAVTDCTITLTHSGYWARQSHMGADFDKSMSSTARDFRHLTPLVLMTALQRAGTTVYEPMHRFRLDIPADLPATVLPVLARLRAITQTSAVRGPSYLLEGDIPAAQVYELERRLPSLTRGEGVLESEFDHYQPVRGEIPTRSRSDHNPLDRKEYLLHVLRRV